MLMDVVEGWSRRLVSRVMVGVKGWFRGLGLRVGIEG